MFYEMLKLAFRFIKDYPVIANVFILFLLLFGYFNIDSIKADKEDLLNLERASQKESASIQKALAEVSGKLDGLSIYLTGKKSFDSNNQSLQRFPPAEYIISNDIDVPRSGYDSCIVGIIRDKTMDRPPWCCYKDSSITEFK